MDGQAGVIERMNILGIALFAVFILKFCINFRCTTFNVFCFSLANKNANQSKLKLRFESPMNVWNRSFN